MTTTDTATVTTQVYRVYIKAPPQAVWNAITLPDWTERYGYCTPTEFELSPGGAYRAYTNAGMRAMGAPEVAVDGQVIESDPPRRLVHTFRMAMDEEVAKEGFTRLTYELEERPGGLTRLTVIHDLKGAPKLALLVAGTLEDQGAGGGWSWILSGLKTLLETGAPLDTAPPS